MKTTAIILSAGKGKRMESDISKQYMKVNGRPILAYTIDAFEKSNVDEIILVIGNEDYFIVKDEILDSNRYNKISKIVYGGQERYDSVMNGLNAIEKSDYVLIHDGARPLIDVADINKIINVLDTEEACIAAVPAKDTIKISDECGYVSQTPNRQVVWQVQTPQAFHYDTIINAYKKMKITSNSNITDDAMVVEKFSDAKIKIVETQYTNIKITTKDDICVMENILNMLTGQGI